MKWEERIWSGAEEREGGRYDGRASLAWGWAGAREGGRGTCLPACLLVAQDHRLLPAGAAARSPAPPILRADDEKHDQWKFLYDTESKIINYILFIVFC